MADVWSQRRASRYGRYDGGPDPLAPPVDLSEALDAIGEDVMAGYSPERALREFLRRGGRDQQGLDDLARRIAEGDPEGAAATADKLIDYVETFTRAPVVMDFSGR